MASKRASRREIASALPKEAIIEASSPQITLGVPIEEPPPPQETLKSTYPEEPLLASQPSATVEKEAEDTSSQSQCSIDLRAQLAWSPNMVLALVDTLYEVFQKGGAADNSFKKTTWELASFQVREVYLGSVAINGDKCKNKWADLKSKWGHWKKLSEMSGMGWNEERELYEAYDYVWENLNKAFPGIIWHKTHIMPLRDQISFILHDVQANGKGALSLEAPTLLDPRIEASGVIAITPQGCKTPYNKGKKRVLMEMVDEDEFASSSTKKLDIGIALAGLTKEMERARRAKENFETNQTRGHSSAQERVPKAIDG